jgi:hypothetical protein
VADTLIDKLKAKLDETDDVARAACHGGEGRWSRSSDSYIDDETGKAVVNGEFSLSDARAEHIIRHDPASVLRQVAADRKILELHPGERRGYAKVHPGGDRFEQTQEVCATCSGQDPNEFEPWPCDTLLALAEGYGIEVPADVR